MAAVTICPRAFHAKALRLHWKIRKYSSRVLKDKRNWVVIVFNDFNIVK
jgi:hypothetical protein